MRYNVIIPAAGKGTRLRPLSSNVSKTMVTVNKKPCLQYILDNIQSSAEEIIIVDGEFSDVRNYTKDIQNIVCIKQENLLGPRDAIAIGMSNLKNKKLPIVVWLGDTIVLDKLPMGDDFLLTKIVDDQSSWCVVDKNFEYYDKPKINIDGAEALVGVYSFSDGESAINSFTTTKEYNISSALKKYGNFDLLKVRKWYDIGDIKTYHQTCAELLNTKARHFNTFCYDSELNLIVKKSIDRPLPIAHEKTWYENLNEEQKLFTPRYYKNNPWLSLSYESGTLLSDMFIYDDLPEGTIRHILNKIFDIMFKYFWTEPNISDRIDILNNSKIHWVEKTIKRLDETDLSMEIKEKIIYMSNIILQKVNPVNCMHGDLHSGNILYNANNDQIIFIDPRGKYGNLVGCLGDSLYDLSKLCHDLYFGYGEIVNNKKYSDLVKGIFCEIIKDRKLPIREMKYGAVVLIASLLPLHTNQKHKEKFIKIVTNYET